MKVFWSLLVFGISLVQSAPSTFSRPYGSDAVQVSRYIGPSTYPGYYVYNYLQIDHNRGLPVGIFADGQPSVASVQPTYAYYGIPIYDHRYHFNQIIPGFPGYQRPILIPSGQPSFVPAQGPTSPPTTEKPLYEDDGIEKLDEKLDPSMESNENSDREDDDDDSVTIDAI